MENKKSKRKNIVTALGTTAGGVAGYTASGTIATALGVNSVPVLTSIGKVIGLTVVGSTPIGFTIGATIAGAAAGALLAKAIFRSGRGEQLEIDLEKQKEIINEIKRQSPEKKESRSISK